MHTPFGKTTWKVDAALIWFGAISGAISAIVWLVGVLEGWGVTVSLLFALTALPLAFISCILFRYWRPIGIAIGSFLGVATHTVAEPAPKPALATQNDLVKLAHALADSSDFASEIAHLMKDQAIAEIRTTLLRDVEPRLHKATNGIEISDRILADVLASSIDMLVLERIRIAIRALSEVEIPAGPVTADDIQPFYDSVDKAIYSARQTLDNTVALADLRSRLMNSDNRADYMLEKQQVTCPHNIGELQYRKFIIAKTPIEDALSQLGGSAKELEEASSPQASGWLTRAAGRAMVNEGRT